MPRRMIAAVLGVLLACFAGAASAQPPHTWVRRESDRPGIIVFLHGLTGGADTWRVSDPPRLSWPQIVAEDPLFGDMNILVYEYPSQLTGNGFRAGRDPDPLIREVVLSEPETREKMRNFANVAGAEGVFHLCMLTVLATLATRQRS